MPEVPTVNPFAGSALATLDLNRFRAGLLTAQQNTEISTGGKQFLRMNRSGVWVYGSPVMEIEEGAEFVVDPEKMMQGFIAWSTQGGKPLGQEMRSIMDPPPIRRADLPHVAAEWAEMVGIGMGCISGEDVGMVFEYASNSVGARKAFQDLVALFRAQLELDNTRVYPVLHLEAESYRHPQYGEIWNPILTVIRWISREDILALNLPSRAATAAPAPAVAAPAPAPAPAPEPAAVAPAAPARRGRPPNAPAAAAPAPAPAVERQGAARGRRRAAS